MSEEKSPPQTPEQTLSDELRELINKRNILTEKTKNRVVFELQREKIENECKRIHLQQQTLKEIICSEGRYLHQLDIILSFFRTLLEPVINKTSANGLFKNLEMLYNLNYELLNKLKADSRPISVADAFIKIAPFLKLYTSYTNEYKKVIFTIQDLRRQDQRLNENLMRQETRPEVGMRLNSLLIVPIQRVPRYILLLKELLQHASSDKLEQKILREALEEIENVTNFINNHVTVQDNLMRLMQIQLNLSGGKPNIIIPGRKLIKEGVIMKVSQKSDKGKPRHFILMTDVLICCKIKSNSLQYSFMIPLRKCSVEHILGQGVFSITAPGHSLLLYSEDKNDSNEWVKAVNAAKLQFEERRKTLQKKIPSRQALRINQCFSADESVIETVNRKRKLNSLENEHHCFSSIKKRLTNSMMKSSSSSSTNALVLLNPNKGTQNDSYFGSLKTFLIKLKNVW